MWSRPAGLKLSLSTRKELPPCSPGHRFSPATSWGRSRHAQDRARLIADPLRDNSRIATEGLRERERGAKDDRLRGLATREKNKSQADSIRTAIQHGLTEEKWDEAETGTGEATRVWDPMVDNTEMANI